MVSITTYLKHIPSNMGFILALALSITTVNIEAERGEPGTHGE